MSHVDEGALHAYLDGALEEYPAAEAERIREHLESCAECAQRLEDERAVRTDAHAMLGLAAPEIDMPSLEELRSYVKRTRPQRPSGALRMHRLGWAASVVLALGAGWMLRGSQLEPTGAFDRAGSERVQESAAPTTEALVEGGGADAVGRERAAGAEATGGAQVTTFAVADAEPAAGEPAEPRPVQSVAGPEVAGAFESRSDLPEASVAKAVVEDEATPLEIDRDQATADLVATETLEQQVLGDVRAAAPDVVAAPGEPAPSDPSLDALVAAGAASDPVAGPLVASIDSIASAPARRSAAEASRPESPVAVTSALRSGGRGVVREVAEENERFDAEPTLVVPGFDVISIDHLGDGTEAVGVRVLQELEDGAELEIYHFEPGADLEWLPTLDPALNEVRVEYEERWVVLRGPRSQEELEGLLARLFPN